MRVRDTSWGNSGKVRDLCCTQLIKEQLSSQYENGELESMRGQIRELTEILGRFLESAPLSDETKLQIIGAYCWETV